MTVVEELVLAYSPDQPRDAHGRWLSTGAKGKSPATKAGGRAADAYREDLVHGVGVTSNQLSLMTMTGPQRAGESNEAYNQRLFAQGQEHYPPAAFLEKAAAGYRADHGLVQPQVGDWTTIEADWGRAVKVGDAFAAMRSEPGNAAVKAAYDDLQRQVGEQWKLLTGDPKAGGLGVKVDFPSPAQLKGPPYNDPLGLNPYRTAEAQRNDLVNNHHLAIASLSDYPSAYHPYLDSSRGGAYDMFRAVHDAFGHAAVGVDFTRHGEWQAWLHHTSMFTGGARLAASTELTGENSFLITHHEAAAHKAGLLPSDLIALPWDSQGNLLPHPAGAGLGRGRGGVEWASRDFDHVGGEAEIVAEFGTINPNDALLGAHRPTTAAAFTYNPDQPRDAHGRWVGGGGGGKSPATRATERASAAYAAGAGNRAGMGDVQLSPKEIGDLRAAGTSSAPYLSADGTWSPERQALHDEIVTRLTAGVPSVAHPTLIMTGGGPASGKSEMLKAGDIKVPARYVHNDPDKQKQMLPEVQAMMKAGDPNWAAFSHEESSYISRRVLGAALERSQNTVLDSTGDSTADKLLGKIAAAHAAGFKVEGNYISRDVETAVKAALERGQKTSRYVPEAILRGTYAKLQVTVPQVAGKFDTFRMYDNNVPKGTAPNLIAVKLPGGDLRILNQTAWDRFLRGHA